MLQNQLQALYDFGEAILSKCFHPPVVHKSLEISC